MKKQINNPIKYSFRTAALGIALGVMLGLLWIGAWVAITIITMKLVPQ